VAADVGALLARMAALQMALEAESEPARFFLGTYLRTTRAVSDALDRGLFEDPAWVAEWDVAFAGFYLDALEAFRGDPAAAPQPWRLAFGAAPGLPPEAHVLLGMNAHINFDLPQSLIRMIAAQDFASREVRELRRRDHDRIDAVLASRVTAEDVELERTGGRRTASDRALAPLNRWAARAFLREARRTVWSNTAALHRARLAGEATYAVRLRQLEEVSAARVQDLLRPGPVLLRLAVHGFGVPLPSG
jgi:hypothetical protein